jgi:hypothetical protein
MTTDRCTDCVSLADRLEKMGDSHWIPEIGPCTNVTLTPAERRAVIEALRSAKDGARYRWLRDEAGLNQWREIGEQLPEKLDAALDAAMLQERP